MWAIMLVESYLMINELNNTIVSTETLQKLDFVCVALICFGVCTVELHYLESIDDSFFRARVKDRINRRRTALSQALQSFVWDSVHL